MRCMRASDEIDQLRASVHRDPAQVAEAAGALAVAARTGTDPARRSRILAVLGRARRALGAIELAEADLLAAIDAANTAADPELAADAHLGLAGVYAFTGRSAEASVHLDLVQSLGSDRMRAYGSLQRAALDQRVGRLYQALAGYEAALPTLRQLDARVDVALVLMNRGVIRTQLADCAAAIEDLTEAGRLFAADGNGYAHAQTLHGLGWAYANTGELTTALRLLDQASEQFHRLGHAAPEVAVDRGEVLLAAGLSTLAAEAAHEAAQRLTAAGNDWHVALAWLLCARANLLDGDRDAAARYAQRARELFARHGSPGWERTARLELIRVRTGGDPSADLAELRELAVAFDEAGNARAAATALCLACVAATESGALEVAGPLADECVRRAARLGVFEVRMQARYAAAGYAAARGQDPAARRQIAAGLADLRRHRATISAPDAQAAVAVHADQLATLGLRLAQRNGSAARVLRWMERVRAAGPTRAQPRPPQDADLAGYLRELRAVVSRIRAAEADGRDNIDLLRRQRDLERLIQRRRLTAPGSVIRWDSTIPSVADLRTALAGGTLVELADIDGRLVGVGVGGGAGAGGGGGGGRGARLADLGSATAARDAVAAAGSALRSLVTEAGTGTDRAGRLGLLRRALDSLGRTLAPVLTGDGPVVLVLPAALQAAPWQLVPALAGRPVAVAPSATWWYQTGAGTEGEPVEGPAVLLAGPRLTHAVPEVEAVAACYPGATVLCGPAATGAALRSALTGAAVAHVACHGHLRTDNALWSALDLFDGPLYLYDLERLARTPPLVVLAGCETGVGVRVGDQLLGLSTVLLRRGTRSLVAARCAVPDSVTTVATMAALHARITSGQSPAGALADLCAGWDRDDAGALTAASLGCFGRG